MVVDDSLIMIRNITQILETAGFKVVASARNGKEAIRMFQEHRPDVVTMDITMPNMDGVETTKKLLEVNPKALVVMVTSHGQEQMVMDSLAAGAKAYVLKPINRVDLQNVISSVYDKYHL